MRERERERERGLLMNGVSVSEHVWLPVYIQHFIEGAHRLPVNPEYTFVHVHVYTNNIRYEDSLLALLLCIT